MLDEQAGARQKQAVAQIRKHEAEEEDIERGHQAVGIHPVVGGQGVHLRDGGQRLGDGVALELDGHHRVVLRRRVGRLPAAGELPQLAQQLLLLGHGHPPVQVEGRPGVQQAALGLLPGDLLDRPVQAQLQRRPPGGEAGHRGNGLLQCTGGLRLPGLQPFVVLGRRSGPAPQGRPGEAVLLEHLLAGLLRAAVAEEHQVLQLRVCPGPEHLGQLTFLRQLPLQRVQVGGGGHGAEGHRHLRGGGRLQRDVQRQPGRQSQPLGAQLVLLGIEGGDPPLQLPQPPGVRQAGLISRVVKELPLCDHRPGLEQPALLLGAVFF